MVMPRVLICLLLGLMIGAPVLADVTTHRGFSSLGIKDGLSENTVPGLGQGDQGFMWFGTRKGLDRYDGYEIKTFEPPTGSTIKAPLGIFEFLVAKDNRIWMYVLNVGVVVFNPATEEFVPLGYLLTPAVDSPDWAPQDISEGHDGSIWISTVGDGIVKITPSSGEKLLSWKWFRDFPMSDDRLTSLCITKDGLVWIGSKEGGITILDSHGTMVREIDILQDQKRTHITDIIEDSAGTIWISTRVGLFRYDQSTENIVHFKPQESKPQSLLNSLTCLTEGENGVLWIGLLEGGISSFDPETQLFQQFPHDPNDPGSPIRGPVLAIDHDSSGVVWASSWFSGILMYDTTAFSFKVEQYNQMDSQGLAEQSVQALFEDSDGTLWVGTGYRGPGQSKGVLHRRAAGTDGFERWNILDKRVTTIETITQDDDGQLWVGTNAGLWLFDSENSEPFVRAEGKLGSPQTHIIALKSDLAGDLWVGTAGKGLIVRNGENKEIRHYTHDPLIENSLSRDYINSIEQDQAGEIWIGTDGGGLLLFDKTHDSFKRFFSKESTTRNINAVIPRAGGGLWLGTFGGLVDFHQDKGVVKVFDKSAGLPNEMLTQLLVDDLGSCWFSMGTGIARLDPATDRIWIFSDEEDLGSFGRSFAAIRRRDGTMVFGGAGGILEFDPVQFKADNYQPPLVISSIAVNDEILQMPPVGETSAKMESLKQLDLAHNQNDITFNFASLDFKNSSGVLYRYRLDGFDEKWSEPGGNRYVKYTNLDPGTYHFRVLANISAGRVGAREVQIVIVIRKPWWTTWPAWTGYLIIVVLILIFFQRQQMAREKIKRNLAINEMQTRHMTELSQTKSKFLVNTAHEFRGPLTLIKSLIPQGGGSQVEFNVRSRAMMERNVARLENLTEKLSSLASLETGGVKINTSRGSTVVILRELALMYSAVAKKRGAKFSFEGPEDNGEGRVDFDLLEKVFSHLLEYAVQVTKHKDSIEVKISLDRAVSQMPALPEGGSVEPGFLLKVEVTHTGGNITEAQLERVFDRFYSSSVNDQYPASSSGIDLTLVKEFAILLGGQVNAEIIDESLTRIRVELPIGSAAGGEVVSVLEKDSGDEIGRITQKTNGALRSVDHMLEGHFPVGENQPSSHSVKDKKSILVIDNDADMRSFLRSKLSEDWNTLEAIDGAAGFEIAHADLPSLILCDERLENMSGMEFCKKIKQKQRTQDIPVIVFLASNDNKTRNAAFEVGADECIVKPYNYSDLRLRIINLLEQRSRLMTNSRSLDLLTAEDEFMTTLNLVIDNNMGELDFGVEELATQLFMSRRTLHRKVMDLTGQTCINYLRNRRLQRAAQLLSNGCNNVMEVSLAVGYKNPSNFSRAFRDLFGETPSKYRKTGL